ncbi:MAG: type IX secretion system sortase PorU [Chlorobi bacterium]|nr:type IX secretion system sortase PorU [Chlorobiota bacterium]
MIRKFITYLYVFFIFAGITNAQKNTYLYQVHWLAPELPSQILPGRLVIDDQKGIDTETLLPLQIHSYRLPEGVSLNDVEVTIVPEVLISVTDEEQKILNGFEINDEPKKNVFISYVNGKPYLYVELIPIIREAVAYRKIKEYSVSVDVKKVTVKNSEKTNLTEYADNSVLSNGRWVKISIKDDGIYKISYSKLKEWGFNNPSDVRIFGNGGVMLPKLNSSPRFDDLRENAVYDSGDALFFYGKGTVKWTYDISKGMWVHQINDFTDVADYFLTVDAGEGLRVGETDWSGLQPEGDVTSYDAREFHELEEKNLLKSGRIWFGEWFSYYGKQSYDLNFSFKNLQSEYPVKIFTSVAARSNVTSAFDVFVNDAGPVQEIRVRAISFSDYTGYYAHMTEQTDSFSVFQDDLALKIEYSMPANTAQGWLNFICLNARCKLSMPGDELEFRDVESYNKYDAARFVLENTGDNLLVWDITDYTRPEKVKGELSSGKYSFIADTKELRQFVAFNPDGDFPVPSYEGEIENQNLHSVSGVDYVIVAPEEFLEEANRLAELHAENDGLNVFVTTPSEIYNEFSSGQPDISAIRDFMRMLYKKALSDEDKPKYLLLFGDGSYDNRSYSEENTNRILTYQSEMSIHQAYSYVTDDFYGCLDDSEGDDLRVDQLDIGIGRFPVNTVQEATWAVDKVEMYMKNQYAGKWKALLTFVGDDGDNNIHMRDADRLATKVSLTHPEFDLNKIYFDSYQKITTATGKAYPEVNVLVEDAILNGTLIFNYTGHGGENGLAHEQIVTIPEIQSWTNLDRLPLFVTATCEFSRFDDPSHVSAGEWVFLNNVGGGIGLFSTTRVVYSSLNFIINNNLFDYIFERDKNGEKLKLGDIMKYTKNASGTSVNILNFTLLADPALAIIYPSQYVKTEKVNGKPVSEVMDTLKALSKASIEGEIVREDDTLIDDYDGILDITVFDKPTTVITLGNDGAVPFEYQVFENKLFTGQVSVEEGLFKSEFFVSKDIRYNIDKARVSYYSSNDKSVEAFGANNDILIGGISDNPPMDNEGPDIRLYLNKPTFVSGNVTGTRPLLIAELYDENGINTSGNGIGHDVTLVIDDDKNHTMVMNGFFRSKVDSYREGTVVFQLPDQEPGLHKLSFKAWDNLNNSSVVEVEFVVEQGMALNVEKVSFFPNPVSSYGSALCVFNHDEPNTSVNVIISTYNLAGQLLNETEERTVSSGGTIQPLRWYPRSFNGDILGQGLYIVRFSVLTQTGRAAEFSQKILVVE